MTYFSGKIPRTLMFRRYLPSWPILLLFVVACGDAPKQSAKPVGPPRFELMDPAATGINFVNILNENSSINYMNFNYLYIGGAVGAGDFNNDGLQDIYMTAILGENKLYINKGNFAFEEISAKAGVTAKDGIKTGVAVVDINGDGWQDIFQCRTGSKPEDRACLLYINNHDLTFTESAAAYGLTVNCATTQASFFDYDLDGDLDVYILNHLDDFSKTLSLRLKQGSNGSVERILEPANEYESDRLYRNNGNNTFSDVTKPSGIQNHAFGLSATITDVNRDGYPDIYVGNDYVEPDNLFINNKNGTFTDRLSTYFRHTSHFTMGVDAQDVNNDGWIDFTAMDMNAEGNERQKLLATAMTPERYQMMVNYGYGHQLMRNMLQINNTNGSFSEIACQAGVANTDWSWAPLLFDFDNDGFRDLYITNGHRREVTNLDYSIFTADSIARFGGNISDVDKYLSTVPIHEVHNYMYRNLDGTRFEDVSAAWGFGEPVLSNGAVQADLDNDGDLDLVVNNASEPSFVYKNLTIDRKEGNYLQIQLEGYAKNTRGFGAAILAEFGGQTQLTEQQPIRGFLSTHSDVIHLGLGKNAVVDQLRIRWPDGKVQELTAVPANQRITLKYTDAKAAAAFYPNTENTLLQEVGSQAGIQSGHIENPYYDFNRERLIPHKFSNLGPCLAVGDVNGDGLEDFYLGGSFKGTGTLYLQAANGTFRTDKTAFVADTIYEDTEAVLFDADGDKDLDLFVVSGGNEAQINPKFYQDRLYINDGKGVFKRNTAAIPQEAASGSCALAFDYDQDGDQDLWVGGGVVPGMYPNAPYSYVLQNNAGTFSNVTAQVAPDFYEIGMTTDLLLADLDGDKQAEILVCGEWMPLEVLAKQNGKYARATSRYGLDRWTGWWGSVAAADFDGDGDTDLMAGNLGLNTRYRASESGPLKLFARDFDSNGSIDPLMAWYENGQYYPVPFRDPLLKQIPSLKKKFVRYTPYAKATLEEVYPASELANARLLTANELQSCYFENKGGKFEARPLPQWAQWSPVKSILVTDLNKDQRPDVLLCGNDYGPEVETGIYDAGNGLVLLNDGKGGWLPQPLRQSGFTASREAREIAVLQWKGGRKTAIVANNNGWPQLFTLPE
jgi:enediyne biosynthesis protein E4